VPNPSRASLERAESNSRYGAVRKFPAPLALVLTILILAVLGAFLHPLALVLSATPLDTSRFVAILADLRSTIADLLGWGVLGVLIGMAVYVAWGRLFDRTAHSSLANSFNNSDPAVANAHFEPRTVVAITAYNDAAATAQAVRDYRRQPGVVQVLVIDNNSTDRTVELAEAAGGIVIREQRQGYGYACIRGLSEALRVPEADIIVLTEGDGTFVADDTAKFLAYMDQAELVVGNRVVRGLVASDSQMDHFFTWGNMAVAMLLRLRFWDGRFLGPAGLSDVGCTFRAIRRHALERILPDLTVGGNHFSPHMLLVAFAHGISVVEIPIRFRRRVGESKGASRSFWKGLEVGLAMIWHILTFTPRSAAQKPGVVVERDGIIIKHLHELGPGHVEFVPGAMDCLAALSRRGHRVVVIGDRTHHERAGISPKLARAIDARIAAEVEHRGGHVDDFVVCPHRANRPCSCRHPKPRLLIRAARRSPLDLTRAVVVSDRPQFLTAAEEMGCRTIFISNGASKMHSNGFEAQVPDLVRAVDIVLGESGSHTREHGRHSNGLSLTRNHP
jgi:dolichol-phosphate mannosyltransferase